MWPAVFPEGQGNDFAGWVAELGDGVGEFTVGDEVIGYLPRRAQADYVVSPADVLAPKPADISWEVAAPLSAVGVTAWAAVDAVEPKPGDTVVVSGAAGGVGSLAVQLARLRGASVIGTAGPHNADFLRSLGVVPVEHGPGLADRLKAAAPDGIDAFVDTFGQGNVDIAIELGVPPQRVNTLADGRAVARYGVRSRAQEDVFTPNWSPNWPNWSPRTGSPSRSARCTRWNRSRRPTARCSNGTRAGRSCSAWSRPTNAPHWPPHSAPDTRAPTALHGGPHARTPYRPRRPPGARDRPGRRGRRARLGVAHGVRCTEIDVWAKDHHRRAGREEAEAAGNPDLVVTLGGDGTFLRGARIAVKSGAEVLGVDLGKVGFLTEVPARDIDEALDAVHEERAIVEERMTLTMRASRPLDIPEEMEALLRYGRGPALPPPQVRPETTRRAAAGAARWTSPRSTTSSWRSSPATGRSASASTSPDACSRPTPPTRSPSPPPPGPRRTASPPADPSSRRTWTRSSSPRSPRT